MEFIRSRPDVVRSSHQRWLLNFWNETRGVDALPVWPGLQADGLQAMSADLSCSEVVRSDGGVRFLIRFHGTRIAETYGAACMGKFLDEVLPPSYRAAGLLAYHELLAAAVPVYTVADMRNREGRIVHYERLLLPFRGNVDGDGAGVERILASLEMVSPEGAFEHRDLMRAPPKPPAFALCTTIHH
jgi:hypothetical protein